MLIIKEYNDFGEAGMICLEPGVNITSDKW